MLGSAAQNVIALSDAVLLYHRGEAEFAAIGFVGVFYITMAAIGYGFSRGGQIMIARRMGERRPAEVGHTFHAMLYFELALACLLFAFMKFGAPGFFSWFIDENSSTYRLSLEYLHYRSPGIFFSYMGVALISLYTGIARTGIILFDTLVLAVVNLVLNIALIFGKWGFPEMGIAGSGLASTIAEAVAFVIFVLYIFLDGKNRPLHIFKFSRPDIPLIKQQLRLALPIVAHSALGQGSWIFFFGMVENMGERALAISNLARTVYLLLSIPIWGFSAGVNTLVSNLLGQNRYRDVPIAARKTGLLCWLVTMAVAVPVLCFPGKVLYPLLGKSDMTLIQETQPVFYFMIGLLSFSTFGTVAVNTLAGTGATQIGLRMQAVTIIFYVSYVWLAVNIFKTNLLGVWFAEIFYWIIMISMSVSYLLSWRWRRVRV